MSEVCGPDGCEVPATAGGTLPLERAASRASTSSPTPSAPGAGSASATWKARWRCWPRRASGSRCIGAPSSSTPTCRGGRGAGQLPRREIRQRRAEPGAGCAGGGVRPRRRGGVPPCADAAHAEHGGCAPADPAGRRCRARRCRTRWWRRCSWRISSRAATSATARCWRRSPAAQGLDAVVTTWPATTARRRCWQEDAGFRRAGLSGVPTFALDGHVVFSGAMPPSAWRTPSAGRCRSCAAPKRAPPSSVRERWRCRGNTSPCPSCSVGRPPARDVEDRPGREAAILGRQPADQRGDLLHLRRSGWPGSSTACRRSAPPSSA